MQITERSATFTTSTYRYGFNGMGNDNEVTENSGDYLDFGARIYDSRLGRWLALDAEITVPQATKIEILTVVVTMTVRQGGQGSQVITNNGYGQNVTNLNPKLLKIQSSMNATGGATQALITNVITNDMAISNNKGTNWVQFDNVNNGAGLDNGSGSSAGTVIIDGTQNQGAQQTALQDALEKT
jgi:hypothetical protein